MIVHKLILTKTVFDVDKKIEKNSKAYRVIHFIVLKIRIKMLCLTYSII